jgi:hypothetical protein
MSDHGTFSNIKNVTSINLCNTTYEILPKLYNFEWSTQIRMSTIPMVQNRVSLARFSFFNQIPLCNK